MVVTLETIGQIKEKLISLFGEKLVHRLEEYNELCIKETEIQVLRKRSHPLATLYYQWKSDVEKSILINALKFSNKSIILLHLLSDLDSIHDLDHVSRILGKLQYHREFESAALEAYTISRYRALGFDVNIIPESSEETPDFAISDSTEFVAHIECKSTADYLSEWEERVGEMCRKLFEFCDHIDLSFIAVVKFNSEAKLHGSHSVIISDFILKNITNECDINFEHPDFEVAMHVFHIDTPIESFDHQRQSQTSVGRFEVRSTPDGSKFDRVFSIDIQLNPFTLHLQTLRNQLKKANQQLRTRSTPGIVYINLPSFKEQDHYIDISSLRSHVMNLFKSDYSSISAVVFSSIVLHTHATDSYSPYYSEFAIPNFQCKYPLPPNKKLGCTSATRIDDDVIVNNEGHFIVHFDYDECMIRHAWYNFGYMVSPDFTNQVILKPINSRTIRVELIGKDLGYCTADFEINDLIKVGLNKLAIAWSDNSIMGFMNGSQLKIVE